MSKMSLNWIEIKNNYPQAFKKLLQWHPALLPDLDDGGNLLQAEYSTNIYFNSRDLYDFFDLWGLYISIDPYSTDYGDWGYTINYTSYMNTVGGRINAECIAFNTAFHLLEIHLAKKHKTYKQIRF